MTRLILDIADAPDAMQAGDGFQPGHIQAALRACARHDDPASILSSVDLDAWERAEGPGSLAAAEATARRDVERLIPGLPARRTYKALGWLALAAFVVDSALAWLPATDLVDTVDSLIRYGTLVPGVALAAWSLLSEVRGWEGSDAATWFAKARIARHDKALAARRNAMDGSLLALGPGRLIIYRDEPGAIRREIFTPDAILGLSLDAGPRHMDLRLTTAAGVRRFGWLKRDATFEAAMTRLAGEVDAGSRSGFAASD